ncbi:MAG: DUF3263 domain-containing protein [Acidimicrobiia bacterium]
MLSIEERAVLDFEGSWWLEPGPKDQAIEFNLGLAAAVYYEVLLALIERPEAMKHDPLTVKRVHSLIQTADEAAAGVG